VGDLQPLPAEVTLPLLTEDGVRLSLHRLGKQGGPPVLLLTGAFSNHTFWLGTRGVGFARYLAEQGFTAHVLDFRGHGLSQRKQAGHTWSFEDWARYDIPAALEAAAREAPVRLVTHSASGAAALSSLALRPDLQEKIARFALLATPAPTLRGLRRIAAWVAFALCRWLGRFPARTLGFGPEDEDGGVMGQWLRWNIQGRWVTKDGVVVLERLPELRMPILAVAGSGDWLWSPPDFCGQLLQTIRAKNKSFWVVGGSEACSVRPGHVGLVTHPQCRQVLWPRLVAWLASEGN